MNQGTTENSQQDRYRLIKLIHVGKNKLALTDEAYRALLEGAVKKTSCVDMAVPELKRVLKAIKSAGFRVEKLLPLRTEEAGGASVPQLEYIKGMWELVARDKTEKALNAFIKRIAHVSGIRFLDRKSAQSVISSLRVMMEKAGYDPGGIPQFYENEMPEEEAPG